MRRDYAANGGWETFLAYEDPRQVGGVGAFWGEGVVFTGERGLGGGGGAVPRSRGPAAGGAGGGASVWGGCKGMEGDGRG